MAANSHHPQFSWADIAQWAEQGLITQAQADAIRQYVEASGRGAERAQAEVEQRPGLNLITIAYYFGAFMILLAYTFFVGIQWESLSPGGQLAITAVTIGILGSVGTFLRRSGFTMAGNLLIFAGTGIVPLLVYTLQLWAGRWPDYGSLAHEDFYRLVRPQRVFMEIISIIVSVAVVAWIRFPLVVLLPAFWSWYLSMDLVSWIIHSNGWNWGDTQLTVGTIIGVAIIAVGVLLQRYTRKDYSLWLYLFGHITVLANLSTLALAHEGAVSLLFLASYLAFVIASVWLQRRIFLVFGALGCYSYVSYLAFQVFDSALGFTFALAVIGLLIVITAVGYQKYVRGWLEQRLGRYQRTPLTTQPLQQID